MLIALENEQISLTVETLGAQMMSLRYKGTEYLWQGNPKYWEDRAPTLFPFIGRLWENHYHFQGRPYAMGIHGFAAQTDFELTEHGNNYAVLTLFNTPATLSVFPFNFTLNITYRLVDRRLEVSYRVENSSEDTMPFGIGGHPGFRVPLGDGESFTDYYLEFATPCLPDRVGFTPQVYVSGHDEAYPLEDGKRIHLHHDLFDEDAIILKNMCREVTLRSKKSKYFVTVSYPQMNYLGLWHWPKTDAPYVCIEPWTSLPARHGIAEEISCKSDLIHLLPGKIYENTWTITIGEEENHD